MLTFEKKLYDGIKEGRVTVAYRSWKNPPVTAGRRYRAGEVGEIDVEEVARVPVSQLGEGDVRAAGDESLAAWRDLYQRRNPHANLETDSIYCVRFHYVGNGAEHVRSGKLNEDDLRRLDRELAGIDTKTYDGEWTQLYIATLTQKRWMKSGELSQVIGTDQDTVRKKMGVLAELGIVRADPGLGYSLSEGGRRLFAFRSR